MDGSLGPTPAKRKFSAKGNEVPLIECVREFRLPQQFPSTVKQIKNGNWRINNQENVAGPAPVAVAATKDVQVVSSTKSPNFKLQKLRILSPNGRDLGEFDVQLRTNDPSKGETVTIIKSPDKKAVSFPSRALPRILKQGTAKIPNRNLMESSFTSYQKNPFATSKVDTLKWHQNAILPLNKIPENVICNSETEKEQICNSDINQADEVLILKNETDFNNFVHNTTSSNNQQLIVSSETDTPNVSLKLQEFTTTSSDKIPSVAETPDEIIELPLPTISLKKNVINCSNSDYIQISEKYFKVNKRKCIATIKTTGNRTIITSLKSVNKTDRKLNKSTDSNKSLNNQGALDDRGSLSQLKSDSVSTNNETEKNVMTIVPSDETLEQNTNSTQECDTAVLSSKYLTNTCNGNTVVIQNTKSNNVQNVLGKESENNACLNVMVDSHVRHNQLQKNANNSIKRRSNVRNETGHEDLSQTNLSNQLDIIKRAMDSIKDNELRESALKALADCGIGIQRYVSVCPPQEHRAVRDTQVQTAVFGLLDPSTFVLIDKDMDSIDRIGQISLHDIPDGQNSLLTNTSYPDSHSAFKTSDASDLECDFDIDNFVKQICEENSDTLRMKETLSTTRAKCKKLIDFLQKDFDSVKRYDEHGMLNIHNAVISDNVCLVQRQLMVLKHCKESADILTEDGSTSLELAIEYDVNLKIVKFLLEAGAQPAIPKYIHESALIIASKRSSLALPMLVKQISDPKLLDQTDSEGLAALHYCSMRGNLQGINVLLSAGAKIDLQDQKSGRTPLFHALDHCHTSVAQALLNAGALANIANYAGQTPLYIISETKIPLRMASTRNP